MDKEEIEYTAQALLLLGAQEQEIIRSFNKRMDSWYPHRKIALQMLADVKTNSNISGYISQIKSSILPIFKSVDYAPREEELLKKEVEQLSYADSILKQDAADAQKAYASGKFGEEAQHKIAAFLQRTEELLKYESKEKTLSDQIRAGVRQLPQIISHELTLIDEEEKVLQRLESESDEKARLRLAEELVNIVSSLQVDLFKEKNLVIDQLNSILRIKFDVESKARSLIDERKSAKSKITIDDIKKDLRKLTKPDELTEYSLLVQQHPRLTDDKCKILMSKSGLQSFKKVKESFFERAWESITDGMTGIFNKSFYMKRIKEAVHEAQVDGTEVSLLVFDLDKFKLINDTYGHKMGDEALIEVVNILSASKKRRDILCRYGGEEFVVIAREKLGDRVATAERMRSAVKDKTAYFVLEKNIRDRSALTCSVGLATFRGNKEHVSNGVIEHAAKLLFMMADAAVYQAKERGRDRVIASDMVTIANGELIVVPVRDEMPTGQVIPAASVEAQLQK